MSAMTIEDHQEGERAYFRVLTSNNVVTVYSDGEVLITPTVVNRKLGPRAPMPVAEKPEP